MVNKGNIPWNKGLIGREYLKHYKNGVKGGRKYGYKCLEETKNKMSKNMIGKNVGKITWSKGKKFSKEYKTKISKGTKKAMYSNPEIINKIKSFRAKQILPKKDTSIEIKIQTFLKQLGIEFFTHQHIKNIEHNYRCDILIPSKNIIIECFGNYWHEYPIGREVDKIRCNELRKVGYKLFVFWENEIKVMELDDLKNELEIEQ